MYLYVLRRIGQSLVVLVSMAVIVFFAVYAIGDPIALLASPDANAAEIEAMAVRLGLDRPIHEQFLIFAGNALTGDLGRSFVYNQPVVPLILSRLFATLELAGLALVIALVVGVPLGLYAGMQPNGVAGRAIMGGSILGFSLPNFWQGMMLILVFSVTLGWLPSGGRGPTTQVFGISLGFVSWEGLKHLLLPALNLSLYKMALVIRLTKAGTQEVLHQDYIRFARAKGLSPRRIVGVHVLKNIMIPLVTVLGLELGSMIAFAVVTESVFAYPGVGKLLIDSITRLDRPVVVAYLMMTVVLFVIINLVVDLIYAAIDPRVRLSEA